MKIYKWIFFTPLILFADTFLVFGGKTGWIGQKVVILLEKQNHSVFCSEARLENREAIIQEIERIHPDFIVNAAGVTGVPNVDWCEDHKQATLRSNILGALNLADIAFLYGIHMTNFGTGCIYEYDETHPLKSGIGFTEEDEPNFTGSFYSKTKLMLDKLLQSYPNVLNLRLRMPISTDFHPKNFIVKLARYPRVIDIPNSMTILDDLLPLAIELALRGKTGNYNFTNPGTMSHNEVLTLYKQYIDPNHTWENVSFEELYLKAKRSNNELDVSKLKAEFPALRPIQESILEVFAKMGKNAPEN